MVINILKDGTVSKDMNGHLVTKDDVPALYAIIDRMNQERRLSGENNLRTNQTGE